MPYHTNISFKYFIMAYPLCRINPHSPADQPVTNERSLARLPFLKKQPDFTGRPPLYTRSRHLVRGLEPVHNNFQYGEYGIIVSEG